MNECRDSKQRKEDEGTEDRDVVEHGSVSKDTKGGIQGFQFDGGGGYFKWG